MEQKNKILFEEKNKQKNSLQSDLEEIIESYKSGIALKNGNVISQKRMLTGRIDAINEGKYPHAIVSHGFVKVIIPVEYMGFKEDAHDRGLNLKDLTRNRLGAEIDYVICEDPTQSEEGVVIGNRALGMEARRKLSYRKTGADGNKILFEGAIVPVRVVAVTPGTVFVDCYGVETAMYLSELKYNRIADAREYFSVGDVIDVKILELDDSDLDNIRVKVSAKEADINPREIAFNKYKVGNKVRGKITLKAPEGIYVSLPVGINGMWVDCLCPPPVNLSVAQGDTATVNISRISTKYHRIYGNIIRVDPAKKY